MAELHRTLERQLARLALSPDVPPDAAAWATLVQRISATYAAADSDRYTLERSIELSGREMRALHERLAAEHAHVTALLASLPSAVLEIAPDATLRFVNPAAAELCGAEPRALHGRPVFEVLELGEARGPELLSERTWDCPDGTVAAGGRTVPCSWRIDPLRRRDEPDGWLLVLHDLTPIKEHEHQVREARVEAEVASRAARARADFLAGMSHELRTPLNAILGYGELMLEQLEEDAPQLLPDMERIVVAGRHLLELVSDVLDLLKIDAGRMVLKPVELEVRELVDQVTDSARVLAQRNGDELVVVVEEGVARMVADPLRVRQCLLNLLSNACKFTRQGRIELRVRRDDRMLSFAVRDTGPGISPEKLARLFQPFVQVSPGERQGSGLGLALTRSFAEQMGGSVTAASTPGEGSTFTLALPVVSRREATPPPDRQ